jgi:Putative DNA-binding domain
MIPKPIDQIAKPDIDVLVSAKTTERRTLEYKELLPGGTDEEKKEFLYDVSSFANAAGGDLIFGVSDQKGLDGKPTGVPETARGVPVANLSVEIARLENILQSGMAPRIPSVQFHEVAGFASGSILILRVPKSWAAPHMVTYKNVTRFYSRNSTGKYPLDVQEIRSAFALSEDLPERLRSFRQTRLAAIVANETPVPLPTGAKVILHIVPISALGTNSNIDIKRAAPPQSIVPAPISTGSWDSRFNFDGLLIFGPTTPNYVQIFRSGTVEAVDTRLLEPYEPYPDFVPLGAFEQRISSAAAAYIAYMKNLQLTPPFFLMLTLIGVKGFKASTGPQTLGHYGIDRDVLILPEILLERDELSFLDLKPVFDTLAQAAGLPEAPMR